MCRRLGGGDSYSREECQPCPHLIETGWAIPGVASARLRSRAPGLAASPSHCTLAVIAAAALKVNAHVLLLLPPLEHAPDQIASRPFETLNEIAVPLTNDAEPVLPTATLMPAGLEVTLSPLRPVAVTVSVTACAGGVTVSVADRVEPP